MGKDTPVRQQNLFFVGKSLSWVENNIFNLMNLKSLEAALALCGLHQGMVDHTRVRLHAVSTRIVGDLVNDLDKNAGTWCDDASVGELQPL